MRSRLRWIWSAADGLALDTVWAVGRDMLALFVTLLSFVMLQRVLGPAEYGAFITVFAIAAPLSAAALYGPNLALLTALIRDNKDPSTAVSQYFSASLILTALSMIVGLAIGVVVLDDLSIAEIGFLLGAELIGSVTVILLSTYAQAETSFGAMTRLRIGLLVIRFFVLTALVVSDSRIAEQVGLVDSIWLPFERGTSLTIGNLGLAYFVGFILYSVIVYWYTKKRYGLDIYFTTKIRSVVTDSFSFSLPMGANQIQTSGDKIILRASGFLVDTGLYGAAFRVVMLGMTPLRALNSAAFQRFLPDDVAVEGLHLKRTIKFAALMFSVGVVTAVGIYLFLPFLDFLFAEKFIDATEIVPWLLPLIPLIALSATPMNGLVGLGRAKERSILFVVVSAISLVLYLILIPIWGWPGAVAGTLISEAIIVVSGWSALIYYQRDRDAEQELSSSDD